MVAATMPPAPEASSSETIAPATAPTPAAQPKAKKRAASLGPAGVYAALADAQAEAQAVRKDGHNNHFDYAYATAEAMIIEAKALLAKHALCVLPMGTSMRTIGEQPLLVAAWKLVHRDHGEVDLGDRCWPIVQERGRPLDRAFAGADTSLLAYFLRDLLQLPRTEQGTGLDDPARDRDRQGSGAEQRRTPAARPAAAQRPTASKERTSGTSGRVDDKQKLIEAINSNYARLNIPVGRRPATSKELCDGTRPSTIAELAQLVRKLKALKPGDLEQAAKARGAA